MLCDLLQTPSQSSTALSTELTLLAHHTGLSWDLSGLWTVSSPGSASTPCWRQLLHPGLFTLALPSSTYGWTWTCGHPCSLQGVSVQLLMGSTLQASTLASEALFHLTALFPILGWVIISVCSLSWGPSWNLKLPLPPLSAQCSPSHVVSAVTSQFLLLLPLSQLA